MAMNDLWAHQRRAPDLLHKPATLLWWDMRTGKTRGTIEHFKKYPPRLALIIPPKNVIEVWPNEFRKWAPEIAEETVFAAPVKGTVAQRFQKIRDSLDYAKRNVVIVNHESVWRKPMGQEFLRVPWDVIVVDEIHKAKLPGARGPARLLPTRGGERCIARRPRPIAV